MHPLVRERARVAALAENFSSEQGFNARLIDYRFKSMEPFLAGASSCLELGCADGRMTRLLVRCFPNLTAVDGSRKYIEMIRARFPTATAIHALFEEYIPDHDFDVIVMGNILEHVADPVGLLARAKGWLSSNGRIIVTVPNADSIHRQVGRIMGLLKSTTDLNESDLRIGHRRVFTKLALLHTIQQAGLFPYHVGGIFFKPLSNAQIECQWSNQLMDAFYELGKIYPDLCAELLVVAGCSG